jgi:hypothetical protein
MSVRYYPVRLTETRTVNLTFALPFGEIHEGGLTDVIVSGTLKEAVPPHPSVRICLSKKGARDRLICADTNEVGQYAFVVQPGTYSVELSRDGKSIRKTEIVLAEPGLCQDQIQLMEDRKN